ncbi:MAG: hypothetical protein Q8O00_10015, partial [Holophaga sp.]|nr:hypothetical protein [Holophaga sp.]
MIPDLHRAAEVVRFARDHGVILWAQGGRLQYRSACPLPGDLEDLLRQLKTAIVAFLADSVLEQQ